MAQEQPEDKSDHSLFSLIREASDAQTPPERLHALGVLEEFRPLVAANVGTPKNDLEEFSKDKNTQVRLAVVQNPNTPLNCLLSLAREFPEPFFANPLLPLLDLTQPGWYTQIADLTWLSLLQSEKLPRRWLDWIIAHKERKEPGFHKASGLAGDTYGVWVAAKLRVDMPELHAHGEHILPALAKEIALIAQHARTPEPVLMELVSINCTYDGIADIGAAVCEQVRRDVAQNPALPEHILRLLAREKDQKVRYRIARHPHTPVDVLAQLAVDAVVYVRSGVAANPFAPSALLEKLAQDMSYEEQYESVQQQIAPKISLHDVRRMKAQEALNNMKLVKGALAGNPATPLSILTHLARYAVPEVRERVATNPSVPEDILLSLANDEESVLWALVEHNPRTPAAALVQLAAHQHSRVRIGVVYHPRTPIELLTHLASDAHVRVREAVAQHPRTPITALEMLLRQGEINDASDTVIRAALARNPSAPREMLLQLANSSDHLIIAALIKNPRLPVELIERFVEHADEEIRGQIVYYPGLSYTHLERLARDPSSQIQPQALSRLESWQAFGERGQVCYPYRGYLGEKEQTPFATLTEEMPFYEMARRAIQSNLHGLERFLEHVQLSPATHAELLTLLLPRWSSKWGEHNRHMEFFRDLLAELELSPTWQRVFAQAPFWQERYFMALKPGIETALLEQLASDNNRYVRAAARWYLQHQHADEPG